MRWRLILEELSPKPFYIDDYINIVADALSRLDKIDNINNNHNSNKVEPVLESLSKGDVLHPTSFKIITRFQQNLKTIPLSNFMEPV